MSGPCLCGDPACPNCFPNGRVYCRGCDWRGLESDLAGTEDAPECPSCGEGGIGNELEDWIAESERRAEG